MEDRSKRTETVRPQLGERCEKTARARLCVECDNDVELNGERDVEDMEDGETGFHYWSAAGEEHP